MFFPQVTNSSADFCTSQSFHIYLGLNFGLRTIISLCFIVFGLVRLMDIKKTGYGRQLWSRMFKAKLSLSVFVAVMSLVDILFTFLPIKQSSYTNRCGSDYQWWSALYFIQFAAWVFCAYLQIQEYKRGFNEGKASL